MAAKKKIFLIDCVNKIKYEDRKDFEQSLFADVYMRAKTLVSEIIKANSEEDKNKIDKAFCTEEQYSNIISFWGERGMGKSSAMLSFALYLKRYDHKIADNYQLEVTSTPQFYVLPRIDAAMLIKGENLLDVLLAEMWSAFEEAEGDRIGWNTKWENTKKQFDNVKKTYDLFRGTEEQERHSMTSVRQLKELSRCLNMKEDLKKLIYNYLDCMVPERNEICEKFFVITIDDLDVTVDDVDSILEQIRMFLALPRVIVLVTADRERIFLECNKFFSNKMINKNNIHKNEKLLIRTYADKYLAKIFPANMRVYMPKIYGINSVKYKVSMPEVWGLNLDDEMDEKKALFFLLYEIMGIMMYPFDNHRHLFQQNSLRTIANCLYELNKIYNSKEGRTEACCAWMRTELEESVRNFDDPKFVESSQILLDVESKFIHKALSEELSKMGKKYYPRIIINNYGELLNHLMEAESNKNHDYIHFVLLLYGVHLSDFFIHSYDRNSSLLQCFTEDIFSVVSTGWLRNPFDDDEISSDSVSEQSFQIDLIMHSEDDPQKIFTNNIEKIYNIFKIYNLCEQHFCDKKQNGYVKYYAEEIIEPEQDFRLTGQGNGEELPAGDGTSEPPAEDGTSELPAGDGTSEPPAEDGTSELPAEDGISELPAEDETSEQTTEDERPEPSDTECERSVILKLNVSNRQYNITIDSVISNFLTYDRNLKDFCCNVMSALFAIKKIDVTEKQVEKAVTELIENPIFKCLEYWKWRNRYAISSLIDLLPLSSTEVIYNLIKEFIKDWVNPNDMPLIERIKSDMGKYMDYLLEGLEKIEYYYRYTSSKPNYSKKLKDYLSKMEPLDINVDELAQDKGHRPIRRGTAV